MRFVEGETNSHVLGKQDMASESPLDDLGTNTYVHILTKQVDTKLLFKSRNGRAPMFRS
jgi:hypothetical protein